MVTILCQINPVHLAITNAFELPGITAVAVPRETTSSGFAIALPLAFAITSGITMGPTTVAAADSA